MNSANTLHLTPLQAIGRTFGWLARTLSLAAHGLTVLLIGLLFSVPQNIGHLIPNPIIPLNSVRISHMIETALSTLVFGLVVAWLLYPNYINRKPWIILRQIHGILKQAASKDIQSARASSKDIP